MFSVKVEKLLELGGYSYGNKRHGLDPGHPKDLAETILALGRISRCDLEQIAVRGGPACCWLATYASFILGFNVQVNSAPATLFRNYDEKSADAQLRVNLVDSPRV